MQQFFYMLRKDLESDIVTIVNDARTIFAEYTFKYEYKESELKTSFED